MPRLTLPSVLATAALLSSCLMAPPMPPGAFSVSRGPALQVQPSNDFTFTLGVLDRDGGGYAANVYGVEGTATLDGIAYLVADVDLTKMLIAPDGTATKYIGTDGRIYRAVVSPATTTFVVVSESR